MKSQGSSPRPDIKTKYEKSISGKNSESNKIAMKSFSENLSFGVDFKLQVSSLMYKINTLNISGVRN